MTTTENSFLDIMPYPARISFQKALVRNNSIFDFLNLRSTSKKIRNNFEICQCTFWDELLIEDTREYQIYLKIIKVFYPGPVSYYEKVSHYYDVVSFLHIMESFLRKWQEGILNNLEIQNYLDYDYKDLFGFSSGLILFLVLHKNIPERPSSGLTRQQLLEFYSSMLTGTPMGFAHHASEHFFTSYALLASRNNDLEFLIEILIVTQHHCTLDAILENLDFFSEFNQREKQQVIEYVAIVRYEDYFSDQMNLMNLNEFEEN